jgi:MYXO-CTERM domain-containing protein
MQRRAVPGTALLGLLSLGLPLGACGEVTPPDPAATELAKAICPRVWGGCCMPKQLTNNAQAGTDEASCEKQTDDALQKSVIAIKSSEKQGRSTYDGAKVEACAAFIRAATCDELNVTSHVAGLAPCASFATPLVSVGGACTNDWECIDGFCDKTGVAAGADGACRARAPAGQSCASGNLCEAALACDAATMTCAQPPSPTTPAATCFYSSGCNVGAGRGAGSWLALGLLALAGWRRRRPPSLRAPDRGAAFGRENQRDRTL